MCFRLEKTEAALETKAFSHGQHHETHADREIFAAVIGMDGEKAGHPGLVGFPVDVEQARRRPEKPDDLPCWLVNCPDEVIAGDGRTPVKNVEGFFVE